MSRFTRCAVALGVALALGAVPCSAAASKEEPTLAEIAPPLGISAQAVNYRLSGAGAPAIRRSLRAWEETFRA